MSWKQTLVLSLIAATLFSATPSVRAQDGRLVEGLLRGFLEVQLHKERQKALDRQRAANLHRRAAPVPPPPPNAVVSTEMKRYRSSLGAFSTQVNSLVVELRRSTRVRGVQPLMADVLKVQATVSIMNDHARQVQDLALLRDQYCDLDCQWRDVSYRLQQLNGLNSACNGYINMLDGYCDSLCGQFQIKPQFDRREIFALMVESSSHLKTLHDYMQYDLRRTGASALLGECENLVEQCRRTSRLASAASYDDLLAHHTTFVSDWRKFAAQLYPHENSQCRRCIRRIRDCNQLIFEGMRKTPSIDLDYLNHISHQMAQQVNELFENMTIKALVQMPADQQQAVLNTARELYGHCQHYCDCVDKKAPLTELVSDYMKIERQWTVLDGYLKPITSNSVVLGRMEIGAYNDEIRHLLHVPARMDRVAVLRLAASLEELANHLRYDVRRYGRYYQSTAFRDRAYRSSDTFYAKAHALHEQVQKQASLKVMQGGCHDALISWKAFSDIISAMPQNGLAANRYRIFEESRQELLPVITELATMLGT